MQQQQNMSHEEEKNNFEQLKEIQEEEMKHQKVSDISTPRLMVYGPTGSGKSTFLNFLIDNDQESFEQGDGPDAETKKSQCLQKFIKFQQIKRKFVLADTVGLFDSKISVQKATKQLCEFLSSLKTMNVIVLVTKNDRVDQNTIKALQYLKQIFGNNDAILQHCIIVRGNSSFTQHDFKKKSIDQKRIQYNKAASQYFGKENCFEVFFINSLVYSSKYEKLSQSQRSYHQRQIINLKRTIKRISNLPPFPLTISIIKQIGSFYSSQVEFTINNERIKPLKTIIRECLLNSRIYTSLQAWIYSSQYYHIKIFEQIKQKVVNKFNDFVNKTLVREIQNLVKSSLKIEKVQLTYDQLLQKIQKALKKNYDHFSHPITTRILNWARNLSFRNQVIKQNCINELEKIIAPIQLVETLTKPVRYILWSKEGSINEFLDYFWSHFKSSEQESKLIASKAFIDTVSYIISAAGNK